MDQMILIPVLAGLVGLIVGYILNSFFPAYFGRKGENLATKEDIGEITQKVEQVRSEFAVQSHRHRVTFEKEMDILSDIWAALVSLKQATLSLRPAVDMQDTDKKQRLDAFNEAQRHFFEAVEQHRPFYPPDIHELLWEILGVGRKEARQYAVPDQMRPPRPPGHYWEEALKNQDEIVNAVDRACELIRRRVYADEHL